MKKESKVELITKWMAFPLSNMKVIQSVRILDKSIPANKRRQWERIIKRNLEKAFHP